MKRLIVRTIRRVSRLPEVIYRYFVALIAFPIQVRALITTGATSSSKVVLFLVPEEESVSGGSLSIFTLYRLSCELTTIHNARVLMCFYPGEGIGKWCHASVDSSITIYPLWLIVAVCRQVTHMQCHVPEYALERIVKRIGWKRLDKLRRIRGLRINILNQNVLRMPPDSFIESVRKQLPHLTCTTAHPSYTTIECRRRWGTPVHHIPAWTYPTEPVVSRYEDKRDVLIVSPDPSPHREAVLRVIATALPRLQIRVIQRMAFEEYLTLAQTSKWSLTFGEGLDDYFSAPFFRGGVGFAVFNEDFFTGEFRGLRTVYPSWNTLAFRIIEEIESLDNKSAMESYSTHVRHLLTRIWSPDRTRTALRRFYQGTYTLP